VSPDGRAIVFRGRNADGDAAPYLRNLDEGSVRTIDGTRGAQFPFWSADSRRIGFCQGSELRHVGPDGGTVQALFATGCGTLRSSFAWAPCAGAQHLRARPPMDGIQRQRRRAVSRVCRAFSPGRPAPPPARQLKCSTTRVAADVMAGSTSDRG
jgi:hypothetical protein